MPLDFDTFVPSHNPSLDLPLPPHPPGPGYASYLMRDPSELMVDQDEAFSRALGAMYWGGYWTAVYHCQKSFAKNRPRDVIAAQHGKDEGDEDREEEEIVEAEPFVSTQR